ncbi:MAG: sugar ABC transporter substrate-binding protein [Porcincola intestinalis]|uniref:sugar ABC transporter substrate-binding protein n=1 Tax=Porcincola intestinalis TaxID=2606632 RepID=UPI002A91007A|nr:sugar ABC transporter substrate-binding protein [Porcincola intestinalis]MDY5331262.1 sugar ABC transporter substrate-binding protein [Porcincola intestinalis]
MKKSSISLILAAAMAAAVSAPAFAGDYLVGFANNSDTYDYCAKFRAYLKDATEAKGIDIMVTDAGGDTNVQNGQIDDFIVQDANVVSAISNDLDGSVPALKAAEDAGIPYISFLTSVKGGDDYPGYIYVGSQNVDAGKAQGEYLVDALPENAKILYFTGEPNDQQYIDRKQGLTDALKARDDIEILDEYNVKNSKDLGMSTAEDCIMSYDHFDAIVCQNDDSALGVVQALKTNDMLGDVLVLGIDGSDPALESIKNGEMAMTAFQDAKAQAEAGADIFAQLRDGTDPKDIEDVYIPFKIVTSDNVDDYLNGGSSTEAETETAQ